MSSRCDCDCNEDDDMLVDTVRNAAKSKSNKNPPKLIQCGACFRSFHTQAQFGQHSRICREGKAVIRHLIQTEGYKYAFLEKQSKQKLEVKSRFVLVIAESENWKKISRKTCLYDGGIKKMLQSKKITNVDVAIRQRKASGLIIANFMVRNVFQNAKAIHFAKSSIESAVDIVYNQINQLPNDYNIEMRLHLCKIDKCKELVIRDTEGFCSRHRAQKYHKKNQHHSNDRAFAKSKWNFNKTAPPLGNKIKNKYCHLLNHLKATAPINNNINQRQRQSAIATAEDEQIVAQILTDLRAAKMPPPPPKKRKLNNDKNNILYMLPIYPMAMAMSMQPVQYAFVPVLPSMPSINHNCNNHLFIRSGNVNMNSTQTQTQLLQFKSLLNSIAANNNVNIPNLPPLASFANQTDDK